jgi:hypothetical protein
MLLRAQWFQAVLGIVIGAAVGAAIFAASSLSGFALAALIGATVGLLAVIFALLYGVPVLRPTEMKVGVPQFGVTFVVTPDARQIAKEIAVELGTRVATEPLEPDSGLVKEALDSLYTLFDLTRTATKHAPSRKFGGDPTVGELGFAMLRDLRPFTSLWHGKLQRWQRENPDRTEWEWPDNKAFRADLVVLQARMRKYLYAFGELAGMFDAKTAGLLTPPTQAPGDLPAQRGGSDSQGAAGDLGKSSDDSS